VSLVLHPPFAGNAETPCIGVSKWREKFLAGSVFQRRISVERRREQERKRESREEEVEGKKEKRKQ